MRVECLRVMVRGRPRLASLAQMPGRIGRHELLLPLGEGETSTVYLARAVGGAGFQRLAAVKVLRPEVAADATVVDRFLGAALASAQVGHPHVVAVHDVGADDGVVHAVMDYIEGDTLAAVAGAAGAVDRRIPLGIVLRVVLDALAGLHATHELRGEDGELVGAVHGDVCPRHVLVGVDGSSRLIDLGVIPTRGGHGSPEELAGALPDRRTDVYATARMLWEAVTLEPMFPGSTPADRARRVQQGRYRPLAHFDPETPAVLDAICQRAMSVDPDRRYATAADLADALEENLRGYLASHREVGVFILGVASVRLGRERDAVRAAARGTSPADGSGRHPSVHPGVAEVPDGPGDISGLRVSQSIRPSAPGFPEMTSDVPEAPAESREATSDRPTPWTGEWILEGRATPLPLVPPPPVEVPDDAAERARFALPTSFNAPPPPKRSPVAVVLGLAVAASGVGAALWFVLHHHHG